MGDIADAYDESHDDDDGAEFELRLVHQTEKAWLFAEDDIGVEFWVPKSQTTVVSQDGDLMTVVLPTWLADEKGLQT